MSGKWLELLKEIAPGVTRVAVMRNPAIGRDVRFAAIQAAAPSLGVGDCKLHRARHGEIDAACGVRARAEGGLIVTADGVHCVIATLIMSLAAEHRLPAVYHLRDFRRTLAA